VSFAYAGPSDDQELSSVFVDEQLLGQSVNFQLVADGLAYPTYYSELFPDLRNALSAARTRSPLAERRRAVQPVRGRPTSRHRHPALRAGDL
jgi:endonuclease YncB( thermonuclease family)